MAPEQFVQQIQQAGQLGVIYQDVRRSKALITAVRAATVTLPGGEVVDLSDLLGPDEDETTVEEVPATDVDGAADTADEAPTPPQTTSDKASDKADAKA